MKDTGKVIGEIEAYPEGDDPTESEKRPKDTFSPCWMLNKEYQGKGYAYEAAYAFFDYLFREKEQGVSMPIQRTTTYQASISVKSSVCGTRDCSWSLYPL